MADKPAQPSSLECIVDIEQRATVKEPYQYDILPAYSETYSMSTRESPVPKISLLATI